MLKKRKFEHRSIPMKKPFESSITGTITIKVAGEPLDLTVTVPAGPVKPYRVLPAVQAMANTVVDKAVHAIEQGGETVSCRKGCGACCRQVVPLAEIEAHQIAALVEQLPEPRRSEVKQRFNEAHAHFEGIGWFDRQRGLATPSRDDLVRIGLDYFREQIPCPFLVDESCSIHPDRPVACREYLVTSPAEHCSSPTRQAVKVIDLQLKPSRPLLRLGQEQPIAGGNFVPLVLALKWVASNPDAFAEKTGERWMADFFEDLTGAAIPELPAAD